ncbi:DUF262 domain-containing protein [Salegentibacter flavus]|uniref:GmrSD restriction endonucleases N-terminal domain-containing protein n=1 Tax=Salegentibacter flavus TaxID=287099 RepID=A0A1I4YIC1_9FLAO|nr:DUF262 domain-containing protein [Salegentibacter flavus]SFN37350.1 Protein of unknown function DUF262 [Salegentibacter flavus]
MQTQKYSVNQHPIETLLSWVKSGEIAIPEIQRPFVWKKSKVRDLMDSLYKGYPIGYIISWRNPDVRLKDGSMSDGKKILIDGQQRITALRAAVLDQYIIDKNYKRQKIKIAFNPLEERFEVQSATMAKDREWIPSISRVFDGSVDQFDLVQTYLEKNLDADKEKVKRGITNLIKMPLRQIGIIELAGDLDIEVVTEIFIRINSKGVVLSQADFAMSKIAANETYDGQNLRKAIDYFCHLAVAPEYFPTIYENDTAYRNTEYFKSMTWLKNENDDLYDPSYTDMLRVSFGTEFKRAKLEDLVSLLSGRNFETRTYEQEIAEASFEKLRKGVMNFMNETNFKRFVMIIKSAGFKKPWMIRSQNAINFAYILYLSLKNQNYPPAEIESFVKRWFVMSLLTGRSSGSFESQFDYDIKQIASRNFKEYLEDIEGAELSEGFWDVALPQNLDTSVASSPYWCVFIAAQIYLGDKGFLSKDIRVENMIDHRGDIHHIFPKDFLRRNGLTRGKYNQVANYTYMQSEINIKVGNKEPGQYFNAVLQQIEDREMKYGGISTKEELIENLRANGIPELVMEAGIEEYDLFLKERRHLMTQKIKEYYKSL